MDYKIQVVETAAQLVLSIRTRTSAADLPDKIGTCYQAIMEYMGPLGEQPSGMPFVAYYNLDMEDLDVEIGFPVAKEVPDHEDIKINQIPAGKKLTCMHQGPYQEMEQTYNAMSEYIAEHGLHPTGVVYEYYFNDPGHVPEEELLTKIEFILHDCE